MWTIMLGCAEPTTEPTHTGTTAETGTPTLETGTPTDPVSSCPWEGTWTLDAIECTTMDVGDWLGRFGPTTMIASPIDGGCAVEIEIAGTECRSVEAVEVRTTSDPAEVHIASSAIADCDPDVCAFDGGMSCTAVAGRRLERIAFASTAESLTVYDGLLVSTIPACDPQDVVTRWVR